jgi:cell wall-associated NlpC family hydrolase
MKPETIWTPEDILAAERAVRDFHGLPHLHRRREPGRGIDCVHLVQLALEAGGMIPPGIPLPQYGRQDGWRMRQNGLACIFENCLYAVRAHVPTEGDIVLFRVGQASNHCGILLRGMVHHATFVAGVIAQPLGEIQRDIEATLTLTAPGLRAEPSTRLI